VKKEVSNPERSFGISVGVVLCAISLILLWRGRLEGAGVIGVVGALPLTCGLLYPPILKRPSALWWRFSRRLGHINARVVLTLLFWIVIVPVALIWRLTGKDPLGRHRDRWPGWSPHPVSHRGRDHYARMY